MSDLPSNIHVSRHPCLRAKLSQLRDTAIGSKRTQQLIHEITTVLACEALAQNLTTTVDRKETNSHGHEYSVEQITSKKLALIPILRSGLSMVEAVQSLLPEPVPVHHLGLFREKATLEPVEYYNNLPQTSPVGDSSQADTLAIILDPIIATGGTITAAIDTLAEWGVGKIIVVNVLGSIEGLKRAANELSGAKVQVEVWTGAVDSEVNEKGMIVPGLGDIGDRLYMAMGK